MAKNCIIYETLKPVNGLKKEQHEGGLVTLSGVFGVCGVRNNNKRVYEASNYSKMVTEMKSRIQAEGGIPGELEHPQTMNMTLENISHKITDINIDENGEITGTIALLNTPKGKIAQAIVEGGLPLFISSRATGNVDKSGNVMLEHIATYDLVGTPGFSQARLHLNENQTMESLNESLCVIYEKENEENNINENDMDVKELLEKFEDLEQRVEDLEEENENLREQLEDTENKGVYLNEDQIKSLANGIQNWIVEEYSPELEKWITEEFGEDLIENHQESITENLKETVEEKFNDVLDGIQNWIVEEYSPVLENWSKTELANGIQNWIVEEYSPSVEDWLNESFVEHVKESLKDTISNAITESKGNNLDAVGEVLTLLENIEDKKPVYKSNSIITENLDEPAYIREMPAEKRVKWDLASQEVKESIQRRAKLYNFMTEGAIDRFWENINFEQIKPTNHIYEGLENIQDERERSIRAAFRRNRHF